MHDKKYEEMKGRIGTCGELLCSWKNKTIYTVHDEQYPNLDDYWARYF